MARKQAEPTRPNHSGGGSPLLLLVAMAIVVAGAYYFYVHRAPARVAAPPAAASSAPAAPASKDAPAVVSENAAMPDMDTPRDTEPWPADLPPLPLDSIQVTQPIGEVRAAYKFAAEHPEVLNYVPCFCGCEMGGHKANEDCFVASRGADGKVTGWDPHGMT